MFFKKPCFFALFVLLGFAQACRFSDDHYDAKNPKAETLGPLLDSARDQVMVFKVFDSASMTQIGLERWELQQQLTFSDLPYPFMSYLVFRSYAYDSSGGNFTIMNPKEGFAFIREFNKQRYMAFLEGRYPKWYPQDSLSSQYISETQGGSKSILTRSYKGVTKINLNGKSVYAHRAGRDSSAAQGVSPPFYTKKEDYYFNEELGLIYMEETKTLQKFGSDSLVYRVIKIRE